jgi:hypothetical protein
MNIKTHGMIAAGLIGALSQPIQATEIDGTFSGEVYAAQGTQDNVNLAALVGLPITGTFSFNSRALPLTSGGAKSNFSDFVATNPLDPLVISVTVTGNTFSLAGLTDSTLVTSKGVDGSFFYLQSSRAPSDEIDLSLQAIEPFLSNLNRSGSTKFKFSAPASSEQGVGEAVFNDANTGPASEAVLEFSITNASAGSEHTMRAPEINPESAASGLTLLLGALLIARGRRHGEILSR